MDDQEKGLIPVQNGWLNKSWPVMGLLILVMSAVVFFSSLGSMALTDRDEGEYAASVSAMFRTGDFVVPTLNGRLYLEKPILVFWAMAGAKAVFGDGEFAARLPSAISAFLLVLLTFFLVLRSQKNMPWACLSGLALAFTPLFLLVARACLTDMLLTLFTTLALAFFFLATSEEESKPARNWYLASWAALALGFLTKGPVALAVVLPSAFLYALWQKRLWEILKAAKIHWGILIFLAYNLPWYGLVFWKLGDVFWRSFFVAQNLNRFSDVLLGHGGGLLYYIPVLLIGAFPFFPAFLVDIAKALFKNPGALQKTQPKASLLRFCGVCFVVVFVVFSLAATKQINYILPAFPFMGILAGHFLSRLLEGKQPGRVAGSVFFWGTIALALLFIVIMLVIPLGLPVFWDKILASIRPDSSEYALPLNAPILILWPMACAIAALAVGLGTYFLKKAKPQLVGLFLGGGAILFSSFLILGLLGQVSNIIQEPSKQLALEAREKIEPKTLVVTYGLWKPSLFYYLDRDLKRFRVEDLEKLSLAANTQEPILVFTRASLAPKLGEIKGLAPLSTQGAYQVQGNVSAQKLWDKSKVKEEKTQGDKG